MPFGLDTGWIVNGQTDNKPSKDGYNHPGKARIDGESAWVPPSGELSHTLQIQLETVTNVSAIITQGHPDRESWLVTFKLLYSVNGLVWQHDSKVNDRSD